MNRHAASLLARVRDLLSLMGQMGRARGLLCLPPMTILSRSVRQVGEIVGRVFSRVVAVSTGVILMVVGLGMTATVVMLPVGIVLLLLGVAIFVGGIFAPDDQTLRSDHQ
jgi:hypothetical protein